MSIHADAVIAKKQDISKGTISNVLVFFLLYRPLSPLKGERRIYIPHTVTSQNLSYHARGVPALSLSLPSAESPHSFLSP